MSPAGHSTGLDWCRQASIGIDRNQFETELARGENGEGNAMNTRTKLGAWMAAPACPAVNLFYCGALLLAAGSTP